MDGQERTETRCQRVVIDASEPEARPWGGRSGEALGAGFIPRSVEIRNRDEWLQGRLSNGSCLGAGWTRI